jgi:hypothetical protein
MHTITTPTPHIIATITNNTLTLTNWGKQHINQILTPEDFQDLKQTITEFPEYLSSFGIELISTVWEYKDHFYWITRKPTETSNEDYQALYEEILEFNPNALIETSALGNIITIHVKIGRL